MVQLLENTYNFEFGLHEPHKKVKVSSLGTLKSVTKMSMDNTKQRESTISNSSNGGIRVQCRIVILT